MNIKRYKYGDFSVREWDRERVKLFRLYKTSEQLAPLMQIRDKIFDPVTRYIRLDDDRILRDLGWTKVIIRGSIFGSDRSKPHPILADLDYWRNDDPRDELAPLVQILQEDSVEEIIHMSVSFDQIEDTLALGSPVNLSDMRDLPNIDLRYGFLVTDMTRLIFDRTGRWGMYASPEEFGLLAGEPEFMERYVEKAGGWDFIREKADKYWQMVVDEEGVEARWVENYYRLAGWDNPPRRTGT